MIHRSISTTALRIHILNLLGDQRDEARTMCVHELDMRLTIRLKHVATRWWSACRSIECAAKHQLHYLATGTTAATMARIQKHVKHCTLASRLQKQIQSTIHDAVFVFGEFLSGRRVAAMS